MLVSAFAYKFYEFNSADYNIRIKSNVESVALAV